MTMLDEQTIHCPYCGEIFEVLINPEEAGQSYIEDCHVCCRPITFIVHMNEEGELMVSVHAENDVV